MKLLDRTIRNYSLYSIILLLVSAPVFYFVFQYLLIHQIDAELLEHKETFLQSLPYIQNLDDIQLHDGMNQELKISESMAAIRTDSFYTFTVYDSVTGETELHRSLVTGVQLFDKYYRLEIKESLVNRNDLIKAIMGIQLVLLVFLIGGMTILNHRLSKKIWKPFYTLLDKLKRYELESTKPFEPPFSTTEEFRELGTIIGHLLKDNQRAYRAQKEFTENTSHEMLTPLAIINSQVDLLMQTPLSEKQAEYISTLRDTASRMARINKSLLLLAKINNQQFIDEEAVDIVPIVNKILQQFSDQIGQRNIDLVIKGKGPLIITANITLAEVLFSNLMANAIKYTPVSGVISIIMEHRTFTIINSGTPMSEEHKIFERFYQEYYPSSGLGLGLSIVKKICNVTGYTIRYSYSANEHSFQIDFPFRRD